MKLLLCRCFFIVSLLTIGLVFVTAVEDTTAAAASSAAAAAAAAAAANFSTKSKEIRIISRSEWGAQPAIEPPRPMKVQPAPYAIISHTATQSCYNEAKCKLNVRVIQTFHIEAKGWADVGYNFLVGGDGNVYEGRGWDMAGAHTHNYNNRSIGVAFVGDFIFKSPTKEQIESVKKLLDLGLKINKLSEDYKLVGQRQVHPHTSSPGDKLFNIIKSWDHWTNNV